MHAGKIGSDGEWLKKRLEKSGADVSLVASGDEPTGHAIIQVSQEGENSIIIHGGANQSIDLPYIERALEKASPGDYVLTQNETSCVPEILTQASEKGLYVIFNPAPITPGVKNYPLEKVNLFIVNESEGKAITEESEPEHIIMVLLDRFPSSSVVLTLGAKGAIYKSSKESLSVPGVNVEAVDTTAAGDTFIGYFLSELCEGVEIEQGLETACKAAAMCVQRPGATDSIPSRTEVINWAI